MNETTSGLAAIQRQIMWNRLIAVVEEQAQTTESSRFHITCMWMFASPLLDEFAIANFSGVGRAQDSRAN